MTLTKKQACAILTPEDKERKVDRKR